ncbi:MAG: hypothetical protein E7394_06280 [Ruminococcaceae bacterium]|nr:hypothetical protein [Oscillospiraceae bacterium]
MKKARDILFFSLLCLIIWGLISNSKTISREILSSLKLWATVLIPSLFPYLVISGYIVQKGFPPFFKPLKKLISRVFNISYPSSEVFLCSLLCGYPCGGICASDIYEKGLIDKKEAQRLICFTNGASPVFLICAVGGVMTGSTGLGILMYAVQTLSSIIIGIILGMSCKKLHCKESKNYTYINTPSLTECCEKSVSTIVNIAGYIVVATSLGEIILYILSLLFGYSQPLKYAVYYLIEISKSMKLLSQYSSSDIVFSLMCACASFGGVSVIFQIFGVINKSLKTPGIIISRFSGAILSFMLGFAVKNLVKTDILNINPTVPLVVSLLFSVIIFVCFIFKKKKTGYPINE